MSNAAQLKASDKFLPSAWRRGRPGLCAEVSFTRHWSAKAELLYLDLADRHFSITAANDGLAAHLMRLG
jgi:hypothetical protein